MEQNNYLNAGFMLSLASLGMFLLSIITNIFLPESATITGFQLFVLPMAIIALLLALAARKDPHLYDNEKKRLKQTIIISSLMIILPVLALSIAIFILPLFN
ncbi:MAG: hypothetical protein ACNA7U_02980 [Candidatus Izemoplasmataceae bacterium]